jgi:hypothetical protein
VHLSRIRASLLALGLSLPATGCERPAPTPVPPATRAPAPAAPAGAWTLAPTGIGPARMGATLAELTPWLDPGAEPRAISEGCDYVTLMDAPDSVFFMLERQRLVRVDVRGGTTATAEGARVGDSEADLLARYPGARVQPSKYDAGHTIVAIPGAPGDTLRRYVFETDGQRVTRYRAGVVPAVEYVEGCG